MSEPTSDDWDDAPYVCPGCHAVAPERCAPGCIDDEIANGEKYCHLCLSLEQDCRCEDREWEDYDDE